MMDSAHPFRVSVLEDSRSVQQMLRSILTDVPDLLLSEIYSSTESALEDMNGPAPDVFIVDIDLPGRSGLEFIEEARDTLTNTQFMVFTIHDDDDKVFQALLCGANGFLLKSTSPNALIEGVHELIAGGSPMSASVARRVIEHMRPRSNGGGQHFEELTERENQVLDLLSRGLLYKEIADKMELSVFTVKNHIRHIYAKLHVQTRVEAANKYYGR
jgi:DNA-binding NarL/FixJ family response regulator